MREYIFTITEHDVQRPWIVVGSERQTVRLEADDFFTWARERWPEARYTIELDPWSLTPGRGLDVK